MQIVVSSICQVVRRRYDGNVDRLRFDYIESSNICNITCHVYVLMFVYA